MNPILRWLIIFFFALWLLLVTALVVGYGVLSTNSGSRWLLEKIDSAVEQVEISWRTAEGSLMQGLEFSELEISSQGTKITADYFSLQWDLFDLLQTEMTLNDLRISNLVVELPESPEPQTDDQPQSWPSVSLPVAFLLNDGRIEELSIRQPGVNEPFTINLLEFSGELRAGNLRIDQFLVEQDTSGAEVSGQMRLTPPYVFSADLHWRTSLVLDEETLVAEGRGRLNGDLANINLDHRVLEPFTLDTNGTLQTGFDANHMELQLVSFVARLGNTWSIEDLDLPSLPYHLSSTGSLDFEGGLESSQIDAQFGFSVAELEQLSRQQVELGARVQGDIANLERLYLDTGFGEIIGSGEIQLSEIPSWDLLLKLSGFDPGHFAVELPGAINAELQTSGQLVDNQPNAELHISQLNGQVRGFPLSGEGLLAFSGSNIVANELIIRAGENRLRLDGNWGESLDFSWNLAAPKLSQLYPGLTGVLNIEGAASGPVSEPEISARISADGVQYQELSAASVRATMRGARQSSQTLELAVTDLAMGEQRLDLSLNMSGNLHQHRYDLQLFPKVLDREVTARVSGSAVFDEGRWTSEIGSVDLNMDFAGQWQLDNSGQPEISVAPGEFNLSTLCLENSPAVVCLNRSSFANTELDIAADLAQIPLGLANEFMPHDVRLSGDISGSLGLRGALDDLQGELELGAPEIILTISQLQQTEFHRLEANRLSGTYTNRQLDLMLGSELAGNGLIDGQARVELLSNETPVQARLEARFSELTWLDPFLPQLSELDGDTNIDVEVSGTLQNPEISGDMRMANLTAFVPEAGILLEQGQLELENLSPGNWNLSASVQSGGGALDINGELVLNRPGDWSVELGVEGDEFNAYALDSTEVFVSPDLSLSISPAMLNVGGGILLPRANFVVRELPASTVKVSRDEVVLTEQPDAKAQQKEGPEFSADINLLLGEQVMFEGFNILGRLAGQLRVREMPGTPQRVEGSIEIIDGIYSAYGQELTIEPGQLVFNGPAENPSLNVRAYRTVEGNLVGIHLGGTVETLSSTLYSAPALPQTEILSLLVTGKSLSSTTSSEGNQLVSALTSLGVAQSGLITESLQNSLNLDVLEISASEDIEDSSLTIGKYLSPKLFISYAQDILTPNSSVSLDYFLNDKIKINAKSGAAQSMDIFYRFERCPDC